MKRCTKCNEELGFDCFYKAKTGRNGLSGPCKNCLREYSRKRNIVLRNTPSWIEKENQRTRDKYLRLGYKKPKKEDAVKWVSEYRMRYPEKRLADLASYRLKPLIIGNQLHHWNYNSEYYLDVIELSVQDHNTAHRYIIYDQERMMYRRSTDNVLLDTKSAHLDWILSCINKIK